jgi:hypothetical protein
MRNRVGHFIPESLLESQFAAFEEPDSCGRCQPSSCDCCGLDNYWPPTRLVNGIGVEAKAAVTTKRMELGLKPGRR